MIEYDPKPINTSKIELPDKLKKLVGLLAENNHDLWAKKRIEEGWSFGPKRDDNIKTHPDLRPYSELTDIEKEYDRMMVVEVLKVIMALGYRICTPGNKTVKKR